MSSCDAHSAIVGSLEGQGCIGEHWAVGLTPKLSRPAKRVRLERLVRAQHDEGEEVEHEKNAGLFPFAAAAR